MRTLHKVLLSTLVLFPVLAIARQVEPPVAAKPTPFTTEVLANFNAWDKDSDGVLEPAELDSLVVDSHLTGKPAAAAGVLKAAQRNTKITLPPITVDYLHQYELAVAQKQKPTVNFDRPFTRAVKRISTPAREVLIGEQPTLETCHQGPLGDCYFISVVGAAVVRDPASVMRMISSTPDGSYLVTFGDGRSATVPPLTDAEMALTSSAGQNGLWLPILEKAFGSLRTEALPEEKQSESATDAIAHGGSAAATIRLLTGHTTDRITFRPRSVRAPAKTDTTAPAPAKTDAPPAKPGATTPPPVDPALLDKHLEETLPKVREHLTASLRDRRLVAAGTPKDGTMPPGVNPSHAYAVLEYNADADTVHLWNPHGNTFKPKGEPGLQHGYPTTGGHFWMPLNDFGHVFNGISFETEKPLEKK